MARSRFDLMIESEVKDIDGEFFPDVLTFPLQNFTPKDTPISGNIREVDINRFDTLIQSLYETSEYDNMILFLSNIRSLFTVEVETELIFPTKTDLERFFSENKV